VRRAIAFVASTVLVLIQPAQLAWAAPCWRPPVSATIADPFRQPACRWCPGNRGIEYATSAGETVRAVASGRVEFAGRVAGRWYVVVGHADGLRVTYGHLTRTRLAAGDVIVVGQVLGETAGAFHFGVRQGDVYIDPAPMIGRLVGVVRLVPADDTSPAPAPPPVLRCRR
jgi:murein DD-endopeptidase MepM/ murein hydrolase activator NlpD